VSDLFAASFLPGILLVILYIIYIAILAYLRPELSPPPIASGLSRKQLLLRVAKSVVPPAALIIAVLGSIFFGIATPTESASIGVLGSLILCGLHRRLRLRMLYEVMKGTMVLTCMVFMVVIGASAFGMVFIGLGGQEMVKGWLLNLPGEKAGFILTSMILIFLLGIFFEFLEISLIAVPLLVPAAQHVGVDLLWYAVLIAMNLQTAFLSPPVGASLFFLRGVAPPGVTMSHIFRGVIPFMIIQLIAVGLLILFPQIALWLPNIK